LQYSSIYLYFVNQCEKGLRRQLL